MRRTRTARRGFTLVELLVAMAVIIALASIALLVVPAALEQDRTTDGAGLVRQWMMIAKSRAARDNAPRGVRLLIDAGKPAGQQLYVTELQYTEAPPVLVPTNTFLPGDPSSPKVVFTYTVTSSGQTTNRQCQVLNLNADQQAYLQVGSLLVIPVLDPTRPYRVTGVSGSSVTLDVYPDPPLGAAGVNNNTPTAVYVAYQFGIYAAPQPLLGEPTLQLPKDVCADLNANVSTPSPSITEVAQGYYDVVFSPSGQVLPYGSAGTAGQVCLWVRNFKKGPGITQTSASPLTYDMTGFTQGGEHLLVAVKTKSGGLGVVPVRWPDNTATGQYAAGYTPYTYAAQGAGGP